MRILFVEDHPAMRQMIAGHLSQIGFAVDALPTGKEAIAAVYTATYDALVLDLGLPDMDGLEVLNQIRQRTRRRLPVLILTARDGLQDRVRGLNSGADDYVVKPFDLAELEARLRAILRRPGVRSDIILTAGTVNFDVSTRMASVDGVLLKLSRREGDLLEELLRAGQRVVVKDVLEERLYSHDDPVTSNALEALVSRLRRRLAQANSGLRIETHRGIGYRLVAGPSP